MIFIQVPVIAHSNCCTIIDYCDMIVSRAHKLAESVLQKPTSISRDIFARQLQVEHASQTACSSLREVGYPQRDHLTLLW